MKNLIAILTCLSVLVSCKSKEAKTTSNGISKITAQSASYEQFTNDKALNARINSYMQLNRELRFNELMDYVYPTVFTIASREQMSAALKSFFSSPGITVKMDSLALLSVDPVSKFSKGEFTKFDYSMLIRMKLTQPGMDSTMTNAMLQSIVSSLKTSMNTQDVTYDKDTRFFKVAALKSAIAINDDVSKDWKFISLENNPQIKSIVPAEVATKYFK